MTGDIALMTAIFVGDVCSVSVGGQTIVVLNSAEAADDLMVKRSAIYSDRPTLVFGGEM
jgi:hypothetical protein